jgi:hypothetical protein
MTLAPIAIFHRGRGGLVGFPVLESVTVVTEFLLDAIKG